MNEYLCITQVPFIVVSLPFAVECLMFELYCLNNISVMFYIYVSGICLYFVTFVS